MVTVLKTVVLNGTKGSNPFLSAKICQKSPQTADFSAFFCIFSLEKIRDILTYISYFPKKRTKHMRLTAEIPRIVTPMAAILFLFFQLNLAKLNK